MCLKIVNSGLFREFEKGDDFAKQTRDDLVDRYGIFLLQMSTDMFHVAKTRSGPFLIHDLSPGL